MHQGTATARPSSLWRDLLDRWQASLDEAGQDTDRCDDACAPPFVPATSRTAPVLRG
jgi:hypothetical protein